MKNLRTIATLLVFTVMTFSCQTNDELVELETLQSKSTNSQVNSGRASTISISVDYRQNTYRELIRNYYSGFFEFHGYTPCDRDSYVETWEITSITEEEFDDLLERIPVIIIPGTVLAGSDDDDDPIGNITYIPIFRYLGTCN